MPTLESTIRGAAAESVICSELVTLMELWRLTGYDPAQRPDSIFFRRAIYDAARVASEEGRRIFSIPPTGIWEEATIEDARRCGVDVFQ